MTKRLLVTLVLSLAIAAGGFPAMRASAASTTVDVRDVGAKGDGVTDDTAAIQKANDKVVSAGGGTVWFSPGTYIAAGIAQDSNVTFAGTTEAVLKHPDGYKQSSIIRTRRFSTTGSIVTGSRMLRVASAAHIVPGVIVAVRGAGERIAGQTTNFPYLYARVSSVGGTSVVLERAALAAVTGASVFVGSTNVVVRDLAFEGNRPADATVSSTTVAIELTLARSSAIRNCVVRHGLRGAIRLDTGTADSIVEDNSLVENASPEARLGASIFLFRGAANNVVRHNTISGVSYLGIALDDRTQGETDWDGPVNGNVVDANTIDIPAVDWNAGVFANGSSRNTITNNVISSVRTGIVVDDSAKGPTPVRRAATSCAETRCPGTPWVST